MSGVRSAEQDSQYPGQDLQLPESGAGSVAGIGRRLAALFIDWLLCEGIAVALLHSAWWTPAVFAAESTLLTAFTGFTVGKRLLGIRVARLDGKPVGFGWALVRTLLFLTVIPPVMMDADLRGLHDKAANTVVIRI
jgi:uncharacterized RDD family membrane protein YckC